MKIKYNDTFEYGKTVTKVMVAVSVVLALTALILFPEGAAGQLVCMVLSLLVILASAFVMYKFCRCPYCGKPIMTGILVRKTCPKCNRNLKTGKRSKK